MPTEGVGVGSNRGIEPVFGASPSSIIGAKMQGLRACKNARKPFEDELRLGCDKRHRQSVNG